MADHISASAKRLRVYLLDDHAVFRDAFAKILDAEPDMMVVGQSGSATASLEAAHSMALDVMVIDLELPERDGIEVLVELRRSAPQVKRLVLSGSERPARVIEAFRAGAEGYLLKTEEVSDVLTGIRMIAAGGKPLSKRIPDALVEEYSRPSSTRNDSLGVLSDQQLKVLIFMAEGKSMDAIGKLLLISTKTVESHRAKIKEKLGVATIAELVAIAIREGLIDPWSVDKPVAPKPNKPKTRAPRKRKSAAKATQAKPEPEPSSGSEQA